MTTVNDGAMSAAPIFVRSAADDDKADSPRVAEFRYIHDGVCVYGTCLYTTIIRSWLLCIFKELVLPLAKVAHEFQPCLPRLCPPSSTLSTGRLNVGFGELRIYGCGFSWH